MKEPLSSPYLGENLLFLTTGLFLVTFLSRKMLIFGDETSSRRHFGVKNSLFWRRDSFSSSLLGEKLHFLATKLFLVTFLSRKMLIFGDETSSRRHFGVKNSLFWRRDSFSSSLLGEKLHFLATRPLLVNFFGRKTPLFGDETSSRQLFEPENATFWRRDLFSSPFLGEKHHFLATKLFLVVTFGRETPLFGDETHSRRHFCMENSTFWRRDSFSSSLLHGKLHFLATRPLLVTFLSRKMLIFGDETSSRRHFGVKNSLFWRRDSFSSSLLLGKLHFLATRPLLVTFLSRKMLIFGDETSSRRHFGVKNSLFWRRDSFSSSLLGEKLHFLATRHLSRRHFCMENSTFWRRNSFSSSLLLGKLHFLATRPLLVTFLSRKMLIFGDETSSRRHFGVKNSLFWRRDSFSSSLLLGKLHFLATRLILVTFFGRKSGFFGDETPSRDAKSCLDKPKTCSYKISHTT
ncbi:hypothetical protein NSQ96_18500 [Caldifermentibacillus hisashii]|uniref:hypothetical protein n=1 Tax=Caldifermentibacillus hisashii TaxID=996558 RepID=UPI0031FD653D